MNQSYIFTENELKVLLMGQGFYSITGLPLDNEPVTDEILAGSLNSLMKKGIITNNGYDFVMTEEARDIVTAIGSSQRFVSVRSGKPGLPDLCCYGGVKITVCNTLYTMGGNIKAYSAGCTELCRSLAEEGYFQLEGEEAELSREELTEFEKAFSTSLASNDEISGASPVLFKASLCFGGKVLKYCCIVRFYLYDYILFFDGAQIKREALNPENLCKYFQQLFN